MALPLAGLMSGGRSGLEARLPVRLVCLLLLPLVVLLAIVANVSLAFRGGADCLGYTALATKPGPAEDTIGSPAMNQTLPPR